MFQIRTNSLDEGNIIIITTDSYLIFKMIQHIFFHVIFFGNQLYMISYLQVFNFFEMYSIDSDLTKFIEQLNVIKVEDFLSRL